MTYIKFKLDEFISKRKKSSFKDLNKPINTK